MNKLFSVVPTGPDETPGEDESGHGEPPIKK